jgi:tRNA pseudouridine55 synthase
VGRRKKGRLIDAVLLLDKPLGLSSNAALQKVRWLFDAQRAGHTGALDPLATGVLPICFGEATKYAQYLLDADKGYYTTAKLGVIRESGDSEGAIVEERQVGDYDDAQVEAVLEAFRGDTLQVPTMYSALKHQGRPLYEWARKGITVERPARPISVFDLHLTGRSRDTLDLSVACSKGTYIRSLVEDIGLKLGCGAHVSMLRRYKAGHFHLQDTVSLDALIALEGNYEALAQYLRPGDILLPEMPIIKANNEQTRSLLHGQTVRIPPVENSGLHRLYAPKEAIQDLVGAIGNITLPCELGERYMFAGVVELDSEGQAQPKRLVNFKPVPA